MVFQVVVTLRENDEDSLHIGQLLAMAVRKDAKRTLGGGGGYLHGRPLEEDDYIAVFCFQKNDDATGDLVPVTENDRKQVHDVMASHPNVDRFLIGPIEGEGCSFEEMDLSEAALVRAFRMGEHGYV